MFPEQQSGHNVHTCTGWKEVPSAVWGVSDPLRIQFFRYTYTQAHTEPCSIKDTQYL